MWKRVLTERSLHSTSAWDLLSVSREATGERFRREGRRPAAAPFAPRRPPALGMCEGHVRALNASAYRR